MTEVQRSLHRKYAERPPEVASPEAVASSRYDDLQLAKLGFLVKLFEFIGLPCRDKTNKDFDNDSRLINQTYRVETLSKVW